jgi:hypothetical protein
MLGKISYISVDPGVSGQACLLQSLSTSISALYQRVSSKNLELNERKLKKKASRDRSR